MEERALQFSLTEQGGFRGQNVLFYTDIRFAEEFTPFQVPKVVLSLHVPTVGPFNALLC